MFFSCFGGVHIPVTLDNEIALVRFFKRSNEPSQVCEELLSGVGLGELHFPHGL